MRLARATRNNRRRGTEDQQLHDPRPGPCRGDLGLCDQALRLAFADHLPPEEAIALVRRLRARSEEAERDFREQIIPIGEALRSRGVRFPVEIGRMGAEYHASAVEYLTRLEAELWDEQPSDGSG